jgi:hypothetical protein
MDKKTTKIYFTIDKNFDPENGLKAAASMGKKCACPVTYVQCENSYNLIQGDSEKAKKDFKYKYFVELEIIQQDGSLWKSVSKAAVQDKANMVLVCAPAEKGGLLGGGMHSVIAHFESPVVFINEKTQWVEPKNIVMPFDGRSETRQKLFRTGEWAKYYFSQVLILGLASKGDSEDKHYVHTYCVQAANKFVDLSVRHQIEELELKQKDMVPSVLEKANKSADSWVSVVSNVDGVFRKSAFQELCETSTSPIMIMPFQEVVGTGGVGY